MKSPIPVARCLEGIESKTTGTAPLYILNKQKENAIYMETHRICPASAIWVEAGERSIQHLWAIRGFSAKKGNSTNPPPTTHTVVYHDRHTYRV